MNLESERVTVARNRGVPTIRSIADLTERIGNLFASPSYQPPVLPSVAVELLDVARYPDIDLKRIARLIERDPMLAGHVMRRVQSPFYAGRVPITNLNQAIFRLGLNSIRDIVLEAALNMRVFTTPNYATAMERVRRHSVATAHIGKILAELTNQDPHTSFLLGLLHDIGIAAALITIDDLFENQKRPPINHIWPAVETIHESAGTLLARLWDLPGDLPSCIGGHHHYETGGSENLMVATLHIAEAIACRLGRGITPANHPQFLSSSIDRNSSEIVAKAQAALGLTRDDMTQAIRSAEERLDAIR
jgi:HD-like signal output (HDOD) protein